MLRIVVETARGSGTVRAEGRVIGPWVEELRRSCEGVLTSGAALAVDLSDVSFVDRDGIELLRSLRSRRVALLNYSAFVAEQLKAWEPGQEVGDGR
jgi:hypothetical protein